MSNFERNLEAVQRVSPAMAENLLRHQAQHGLPVQLGPYVVEPARSGLPTLRYSPADGAEGFYVHSPYDPLREGEQFAAQVLEDHPRENLNVLFGLGLGYQAQALARLLPANERMLIFEPHWELLYLAFCHNDLTELFARGNLTMTTSTAAEGRLLGQLSSFEMASFSGLRLISNPAFERLPGASGYKAIADRLRYEVMAVGGNLQTLMVMGEMQQMNILLNFPQILDNPPFANLLGRFTGKPAVIVSAGPSLDKNMHRLRELDERALIIAVDTATKPLLRAGITPHVVVTGDPQEANARHLWGVDLPSTYLIAEPQSPVSAVEKWTGPRFICSFHDNLMQWVDRLLGDRGRLRVWGSVAVMAYDCAIKLGADPIVFIGQDLSFPGGRTYAGGTYFETDEKQEMSTEQLRQRGEALIEMTDIHGEQVLTNRQMYAYFNYLSDQFWSPEARGRRIINATEGGILHGPRVTVMDFDQAIREFMQEPLAVREILAAAHAAGGDEHGSAALHEIERTLAELRQAQEACRRGVEYVQKTIAALQASDGSDASEQAVAEQFQRVTALRSRLLPRTELARIVEMANHAGIFAFTQGWQQVLRDDAASGQTDRLRHCYHFHTLYSTTGAAIGRLIPLFEHCRDTAQQRLHKPELAGVC